MQPWLHLSVAIERSWMTEPFHVTAIVTQTCLREASGWKFAATHASQAPAVR
jgi:hypothetical protein